MSFKKLDQEDFITSADSVVSPAWSGNKTTLTTFFTSSAQIADSSGNYFLNVYNVNPQTSASLAEVQFSLAYANKTGGGAAKYNTNYSASATSTLYGQMRNVLLEDEESSFILGDNFYVVNVDRTRYREKLMPGTWGLTINGSVYTDNSKNVSTPEYYGSQRVYRIGVDSTPGNAASGSSSGLFFPDTSIMLLTSSVSTPTNTYTAAHNERTLFPLITSFTLQSEETITSNYIFVRARNSEFNYSSNPSFISGSTGEVIHNSFIYNPQTYPTTVGFYNDSNELLAVAKLSKPLLKDSTKEILIRTKLDF